MRELQFNELRYVDGGERRWTIDIKIDINVHSFSGVDWGDVGGNALAGAIAGAYAGGLAGAAVGGAGGALASIISDLVDIKIN